MNVQISIPPESAIPLTEDLLKNSQVELAGLAARDSLRLEAGLCLYGHDLNETISPVEASLNWLIGKDRRQEGNFIGSETILEQLSRGPTKRRVGLIVEEAPAREGSKIFDAEGKEEIGKALYNYASLLENHSKSVVGVITSGIPSPTLGQNIAMG